MPKTLIKVVMYVNFKIKKNNKMENEKGKDEYDQKKKRREKMCGTVVIDLYTILVFNFTKK